MGITRKSWEDRVEIGSNTSVFKVSAHKVTTDAASATPVTMVIKLAKDSSSEANGRIALEVSTATSAGPHPYLLPIYAEHNFGEGREELKGYVTDHYSGGSIQDELAGRDYQVRRPLAHTNIRMRKFIESSACCPQASGPLPSAVPVACALFRAAAHLARHNIIHRDVKPHNLVVPTSGSGAAVLIDLDSSTTTTAELNPDLLTGSPNYISPEAVWGVKRITTGADVFSCGCVLARLLLGSSLIQVKDGPETIRRREATAIVTVLGPIPQEALDEMGAVNAEGNKPMVDQADPKASIATRFAESKVTEGDREFYASLVKKCLNFVPSSRPSAFHAFKELFSKATAEEKQDMAAFTEEEKRAADAEFGGKAGEAKSFFSAVYH